MRISVLILMAILTITKAANNDECLNALLTAADETWEGGASCDDVPSDMCDEVCAE